MAGKRFTLRWRPYGSLGHFFSEDGSGLGCAWTDGVDTRWGDEKSGLICLPPQKVAVDISSAGSSALPNCFVLIPDASGNWYLYIGRGTGVVKIEPSTLAVITAGSPPAGPGGRIMCLLATKAPNGAWMLSKLDGVNAFTNCTTIAVADEGDTSSANNEGSIAKIAYAADGDHDVWLVENKSATKGETVRRNVLSTAINMDASNLVDVASVTAGATPTGMVITDDLVLLGTNRGPMLLNTRTARFQTIMGKVAQDANNCRVLRFVDWLGVIFGVGNQIRIQRGTAGRRIGPITWQGNDSDIQGKLVGASFDGDFIYVALRNSVAGKTFFLAARPGNNAADGLEWHCIGSQTGDCEIFEDIGTAEGERTQPVLFAGNGTDAIWYALKGITPRWIDDSAYRYDPDTDYTWYGTEYRRKSPAKLVAVRFEGQNLAAARTLTLKMRTFGKGVTSDTVTLTSENSDGNREKMLDDRDIIGWRFRPEVVLKTNANTASPQLVGDIEFVFEEGA